MILQDYFLYISKFSQGSPNPPVLNIDNSQTTERYISLYIEGLVFLIDVTGIGNCAESIVYIQLHTPIARHI